MNTDKQHYEQAQRQEQARKLARRERDRLRRSVDGGRRQTKVTMIEDVNESQEHMVHVEEICAKDIKEEENNPIEEQRQLEEEDEIHMIDEDL